MISTLPGTVDEGQEPKYGPMTVADVVGGAYKRSYGAATKFNTDKAATAPKADVSSTTQPIAV